MGTSVKATCACGYDSSFRIGGRLASFQTWRFFPYKCSLCGIVECNIAEPPKCPNSQDHMVRQLRVTLFERLKQPADYLKAASAFGSPFRRLLGLRRSRILERCGNYKLYDEPYRCPSCSRFGLRFKPSGIRAD